MKNKIITASGLILTLMLFVLTGCLPSRGEGGPPGNSPAAAMEKEIDKSINVVTVEARRGTISGRLMLSGDVEAFSSVDVYPPVAGELSSLLVSVGSYVFKDQVLAQIDPSRPGMRYAESPVEAPVAGTITAVNADTGATVAQQMPLFTIGDISRLVISAQVPERFIYMVEIGQTAHISTTASPGRSYRAQITSISPVVNPSSRTLSIELTLIEPSPIKAGMFVGIDLITSTKNNTLILPKDAVMSRDEQEYVFRASGDTAEKVHVETGINDSGYTEILSGIEEGDRIITQGTALLSDGSSIRILEREQE